MKKYYLLLLFLFINILNSLLLLYVIEIGSGGELLIKKW